MNSSIHHTQEFYEKKRIAIEKKTKVCIKCKTEKDKACFTTDRKHKDGKHPICVDCKRVLQRKLYKKQPERFYATHLRAKEKFPEKVDARRRVYLAVKNGDLKKKGYCEECGATNKRIEAHHFMGYDEKNVLTVKWLCSPCHRRADAVE